MSFVTDTLDAVTGKGASKAADKAAGKQGKLADAQRDLLLENLPLIQQMGPAAMKLIGPALSQAMGSYESAQQFDPAQETERAMLAFDTAAKSSLESDLGNTNTPFSMRGFTSGNGSTDQAGANADILSRRATDRGMYASNLKMNERNRKDEVMGRASDQTARAFSLLNPTGSSAAVSSGLQGPANTYGQQASMYGQQAGSAPIGALIPLIGNALKGIKF